MNKPENTDFLRLDGLSVTLIVAVTESVPVIVYWGPTLGEESTGAMLATIGARGEAPSSPAIEAPVALTPQAGQGFPGRPGLIAHRDGRDWASHARIEKIDWRPEAIVIDSRDTVSGIALRHALAIEGDVLVASSTLANIGDGILDVAALAAPVVPLPAHVSHLIGFEGRWSGEFQTRGFDRGMGQWVRENRRGRSSHDSFPAIIATALHASETSGVTYGFHLGWSGNHRLTVETLGDGRGYVAMEALLLPGEMRLAPGESYRTPELFASVSNRGLTGLSRQFHDFVRARPEHDRLRAKPRPIHYNSWEAVYFDHDPAVLMELASRAASVGAERFVLDDGWFQGRRSDRAGLGDWAVDRSIYPDGLGPLIAHVQAQGMEFGLWVEPEMVNPDSDLYRAHPDWALATPSAPAVMARHQLVLDFSRAEVRDHLFARIDALLRDHPIAYLKWDMNRDLNQPGGLAGRAAADAHVRGVYEVLDRLRAAYPDVEIESCASGGGRADFGILARTDRVWTSDSNDALDRLPIQRGFSLFMPAELMGAHVGPAICHITGRRLSMALRVQTALFGHMGIEMDLRTMDAAETAELAAGVMLHKAHRALIHTGDLVRLATADGVIAFLVVARDLGDALLSYTCITEQRASFAAPLLFAGLDAEATYRISFVWPRELHVHSPIEGAVATGDVLMKAGLQPPRLHPETGFILHLVRCAKKGTRDL